MRSMKINQRTLTAACALTAVLTGGAIASAANAKVCFEAEGASSVKNPVRKVLSGANSEYSGRGYLEIPWDQNKTKGQGFATYVINVKTPGTYYLWARTFWANGCGNSISVSVNNSGEKMLGEDGTYDKWHWVGGKARVTLKAGANRFTVHNRETGVRVDQIFLCQSSDYIPTNKRKVTN